jgi:crossover junction endodeoxyribonuclease RuvC
MIVLGVDPGSRNTGYGIIRRDGARYEVVGCGVIRPGAALPLVERIGLIWKGLEEVASGVCPDAVALETAFVGRNIRSALVIGQVRGAVIALAARLGRPVREYAPSEVKVAVTGHGSAGKEQVAAMIGRLLPSVPQGLPPDATDALAIAWCDLARNAVGRGMPGSPAQGDCRKKKKQDWSAYIDRHPELVA